MQLTWWTYPSVLAVSTAEKFDSCGPCRMSETPSNRSRSNSFLGNSAEDISHHPVGAECRPRIHRSPTVTAVSNQLFWGGGGRCWAMCRWSTELSLLKVLSFTLWCPVVIFVHDPTGCCAERHVDVSREKWSEGGLLIYAVEEYKIKLSNSCLCFVYVFDPLIDTDALNAGEFYCRFHQLFIVEAMFQCHVLWNNVILMEMLHKIVP